jgi:uncharacterized protein (TIGR00255 family)
MTGYGRASQDGVTVEIKSVNHRYLDVSVRTPRGMPLSEEAVKTRVAAAVSRGKVDVAFTVENGAAHGQCAEVSYETARMYMEAAKRLSCEIALPNDLTVFALLRLPGVVREVKTDADESMLAERLSRLLESALEVFNEMRRAEGERLCADILEKVLEVERLVAFTEIRSPESVAAYRQRLEQKLSETLRGQALDENRIMLEAAIFSDRVTVDEETVRMKSHMVSLRETLRKGGVVGKKIDFITQELAREANTIGSKNSDTDIGKAVIDMKTAIEKIREQAQNIE